MDHTHTQSRWRPHPPPLTMRALPQPYLPPRRLQAFVLQVGFRRSSSHVQIARFATPLATGPPLKNAGATLWVGGPQCAVAPLGPNPHNQSHPRSLQGTMGEREHAHTLGPATTIPSPCHPVPCGPCHAHAPIRPRPRQRWRCCLVVGGCLSKSPPAHGCLPPPPSRLPLLVARPTLHSTHPPHE